MSYSTISQCVTDPAFSARVNASIAQEQIARGEEAQPGMLIGPLGWAVASASDVEAAYASALAANNPNPGGDESVITDGMILAHVQGNWPTPGVS
jgi:hypothetical protein